MGFFFCSLTFWAPKLLTTARCFKTVALDPRAREDIPVLATSVGNCEAVPVVATLAAATLCLLWHVGKVGTMASEQVPEELARMGSQGEPAGAGMYLARWREEPAKAFKRPLSEINDR